MNRFKCPRCGKDQYSASPCENTPCIYCGNSTVIKMAPLEDKTKEYTLYLKNDAYFCCASDRKPSQYEICKKIKTFQVDAPFCINAGSYRLIYAALINLGFIEPKFTHEKIAECRYRVIIDNEYFGMFDTQRNTFVD